jgi:hypothetical protein
MEDNKNKNEDLENVNQFLEKKIKGKAKQPTVRKANKLGNNLIKIGGTAVLGAAIGVAGGMVLVAGAAAVEGTLLSYVVFTKVLGAAGAAAGAAHGISSVTEEKKAE